MKGWLSWQSIQNLSIETLTTSGNVIVGGDLEIQGYIRMALNERIEFTDANEYIYGDGTGLIFGIGGSNEFGLDAAKIYPTTNRGLDLGGTSNVWANFHIDTCHGYNATQGVQFQDKIRPTAAGTYDIGDTTFEWRNLYLADGGIIYLGLDQDVTLTHVADTGLLLNAAMQLQFRDSAISISSAADGRMDIDADVSIDLNTPIVRLGTTDRLEFRDTAIYIASLADGTMNLISDISISLSTPIVYTDEYIIHAGDADTWMRYEVDKISWVAGNVEFVNFTEAATDVVTWGAVTHTGLVASGDVTLSHSLLDIQYENLKFTPVTAPTACTGALAGAGAGNVDDGVHIYKVTSVSDIGETELGTASNTVTVVDKAADGQVSLTGIPTGTSGVVTSRKVYRTKAGGSTYWLLTTIADNTTTTYTDNTADAGLGADVATYRENTTAGYIYVGATKAGFIGGKGYTFLGFSSGINNTTGSVNTFIGGKSGYSNTTGSYNMFTGHNSGYSNTTGDYNVFLGQGSGYYNQAGIKNAGIGAGAGQGSSAHAKSNNVMVGYRAGYATQTADNNILIGYQAGDNLTTGNNNIIIGYNIDTAAVDSASTLNIGGLITGDIAGVTLGLVATTFTGDVSIGANLLKTTNLGLKQDTSSIMAVRNAADSAYLGFRVADLYMQNAILSENSAGYLRAHDVDGGFFVFKARNSTSNLQEEIGRLTGANDSYFSFGSSQEHKFTATGLMGLYGVAAVARSAGWTITNDATDRAFDADTVAVAELADVVATLITDLAATGIIGASA